MQDPAPSGSGRGVSRSVWALVCMGGLVFWSATDAQPSAAKAPQRAPHAEQGTRWSELKPAQQAALKPLEQEWAGIDASRKQKWLDLSGRFSKLTPEEQSRVQTRMAAWARLTPRERGEARLNFQEAKHLPVEDREARWKAYQALSPEQRKQMEARAAAANKPQVRAAGASGKSNIVPNPELAAHARAIGPTVVQAGPGATTTLITRRPTPPVHQQTGMPKIAATPGFVDKSTLLPQRGPQGAAIRSVAPPVTEIPPHQ